MGYFDLSGWPIRHNSDEFIDFFEYQAAITLIKIWILELDELLYQPPA